MGRRRYRKGRGSDRLVVPNIIPSLGNKLRYPPRDRHRGTRRARRRQLRYHPGPVSLRGAATGDRNYGDHGCGTDDLNAGSGDHSSGAESHSFGAEEGHNYGPDGADSSSESPHASPGFRPGGLNAYVLRRSW